MKPKDASLLFERMSPDFAAGFLGRMRPDAAAAIMSGLPPELGYSISVLLAGRNADAAAFVAGQ
jgi:flagellar motility protein MotE (MotC chaperone)